MKLLFLLVAGIASIACAQEFKASVDRNPVGVGEEFTYTLELSNAGTGGGKNLKLPEMSKFRIVSGPSTMTNMQIVNGSMSSSVRYSYVLQAREIGKVTIGSSSIDAGGKTYNSNTIALEVTKSSPRPKQQAGGKSDVSGQISENVFLRAQVSRTHAMQGEQINVVFKLYTRLNLLGLSYSKNPTMTGFWGEDQEFSKEATTETVNGKQFRVQVLKKTALFPTQSGTLEISAMEVQTQVQVPRPRSNDPFAAFFDDPFGRTVNYTAQSEPLKVVVDPLPGSAPAEFKGAIGQFAMTTTTDKKTTRTNEPVSLKVTITGTGNVKLLEAPALELPPDFEQYSPKVSDNINRQGDRISGSKTFEYLLIPRYPGMKTIKPVSFVYFDLAKREYVHLRSPEIEVNVEQGTAPPPTAAGMAREDVRVLSQDIRFIKAGSSAFVRQGEHLFNRGWFVALFLLPFAGVATAIVYTKNRRALLADVAGYRNRKAIGVARKRLKAAEKLLADLSPKAGGLVASGPKFFAELAGAMWHYLGDKLGIPQAEFSVEGAVTALKARNVPEKLVESVRANLETCDMVRFAPTSIDRNAMQQAYDEARRIIVELERTLNAS